MYKGEKVRCKANKQASRDAEQGSGRETGIVLTGVRLTSTREKPPCKGSGREPGRTAVPDPTPGLASSLSSRGRPGPELPGPKRLREGRGQERRARRAEREDRVDFVITAQASRRDWRVGGASLQQSGGGGGGRAGLGWSRGSPGTRGRTAECARSPGAEPRTFWAVRGASRGLGRARPGPDKALGSRSQRLAGGALSPRRRRRSWKFEGSPGQSPGGTMVCHTLFALLVFATGLKVQSLPTSTTFPVSLPAKFTTLSSTWTNPPQNTVDVTTSSSNNTQNSSLLTVTLSAETTPLPGNTSLIPGDPESTSQASVEESAVTTVGLDHEGTAQTQTSVRTWPTSSQGETTTTLAGLSSATPTTRNETEAVSTASPPPSDTEAVTSSQAASSLPSWLPPKVSPTSVATNSVTAKSTTHKESSEEFLGTPTTTPHGADLLPSGTPTFPASSRPKVEETTSQGTLPNYEVEGTDGNTVSPRIIMEEVEHALSSGSIVAITVTVIAVVLLVFGVAAYLKIRHSSYGRLLDDHDYGSWGNYNNPLYDDS
ncbi:prostate androgen-regulated mucin-like protein 1 [Sminthopsis crassicaudata]|uniref:prostate androgen-regulated mucin-like protein 1 n=1 Tax=Sminthopsis crassicaudata TaxID=9301 RepID=UPI003D684A10